jgi:hypothetical protein
MALRLFGETAALRDFDPAYARLGVTTGRDVSSMSGLRESGHGWAIYEYTS